MENRLGPENGPGRGTKAGASKYQGGGAGGERWRADIRGGTFVSPRAHRIGRAASGRGEKVGTSAGCLAGGNSLRVRPGHGTSTAFRPCLSFAGPPPRGPVRYIGASASYAYKYTSRLPWMGPACSLPFRVPVVCHLALPLTWMDFAFMWIEARKPRRPAGCELRTNGRPFPLVTASISLLASFEPHNARGRNAYREVTRTPERARPAESLVLTAREPPSVRQRLSQPRPARSGVPGSCATRSRSAMVPPEHGGAARSSLRLDRPRKGTGERIQRPQSNTRDSRRPT